MAKKKGKVPKRIAGVKIPKPIRRGPVGDFLGSSGGQVLVAEALIIAGSALLAKRDNPNSRVGELIRHPFQTAKAAGGSVASTASEAGESMNDARHRLAGAFSAAVEAFREALDRDDDLAATRVDDGRLVTDREGIAGSANESDEDLQVDDAAQNGEFAPPSAKKKRASGGEVTNRGS